MFDFDLNYEEFGSLNMHQIKNIREQIPRAAFTRAGLSAAYRQLRFLLVCEMRMELSS